MGNRFDKQQLDMNQEICKHRFCGQSQVTEQAHANAYAPMIDAKSESEKLKATERLKDEESFAKRHPGLIKALIIAASLFVVGILILAALSKVKSINGKETATGSELGDAAIKGTGKLAIVGGVLGLVGGGIAAGVSASKDSSTGSMIDEYREKSMKLAIDNHLDLQEQHGEVATRLASVNGEVAVDVAEAHQNLFLFNIRQIPENPVGCIKYRTPNFWFLTIVADLLVRRTVECEIRLNRVTFWKFHFWIKIDNDLSSFNFWPKNH